MTAVGRHRSLAVVLILLAVITSWGLHTLYRYWERQELLHSSQQHEQLALHLETLLEGLQSHVKRMQHIAHLALHGNGVPVDLRSELTAAIPATAQGHSLDVSQQQQPSAQRGNIFLAADPANPELQAELKIIWALFPQAAASHLTDSALQWSYYSSLRSPLLSIFPYRSTERLLRDSDSDSLPDFFADYLPPATQRQVAVGLQSQQDPIWRAPHVDAAGAGWVVPLVAPVRQDDNIIGAVSADVRLSFLSAHLARLTASPERTLLINDEQLVLADSRLSPEFGVRLPRLSERLPASLAGSLPRLTRATPGWTSVRDYHLMLRPLAHSQWSLVRVMPSDELLFAIRLRLLAIAAPLAALWLLLVMYWWVKRQRMSNASD